MRNYDYDVAVVGSGSGGLTVAFGLSAAGKKVVMIEKGLLGGDCTNFGCIPSKALIDISKHSPGIGLKKALEQVRSRRKIIRDEETQEKIESHGPKVLQGFASFVDEHTLNVASPDKGTEELKITAEKIILSTGSRPSESPMEGIDSKDVLTNETIFEQKSDIKNLVIIGGGYIGCELAESISDLGTHVTIIQRNDVLIPREESESSQGIRKIFEKKGIVVHTGSDVKKASKTDLTITGADGKEEQKIPYDKVLFAIGRTANIEKLNLDIVGIKSNKKGIIVDKFNRTNKKHIFAIGDCVSGNPQFTHWANNEGRGVIRNLIVPIHNKSVRNATLPAVLYTHKEIARVGQTESEIQKKYSSEEYISKIMYFDKNDRSKVTDDTTGFIKINFKRLTGKILGATVFGTGAGEMLPILTAAMDNNISAYKLSATIQPYPTKSDMIKRVLDSYVVGTLGDIRHELKLFLKNNALQIATAVIWLTIIIIFFSYKNTSGLSFEEIALALYNFLGGTLWGPILYILIYGVRSVVLFPSALMTFMSGALFGFVPGLIYTLVGATISAMFALVLGGVFGKKLLGDEGGGMIDTLRKQMSGSPFMSTLMTRLLFFPFDLTNYVCGLMKVPWRPFIIATFVGIIPGTAVFVLAGAAFYNKKLTSFSDALSNIDTTLLIWSAILLVLTLGFAKLLKRLQK